MHNHIYIPFLQELNIVIIYAYARCRSIVTNLNKSVDPKNLNSLV